MAYVVPEENRNRNLRPEDIANNPQLKFELAQKRFDEKNDASKVTANAMMRMHNAIIEAAEKKVISAEQAQELQEQVMFAKTDNLNEREKNNAEEARAEIDMALHPEMAPPVYQNIVLNYTVVAKLAEDKQELRPEHVAAAYTSLNESVKKNEDPKKLQVIYNMIQNFPVKDPVAQKLNDQLNEQFANNWTQFGLVVAPTALAAAQARQLKNFD